MPDKDKSKFLKIKDKQFICDAVRICPNQTAKELLRNIADSPTKRISLKQKKSVERMVRSERKRLVSCQFEGIIVDNLLNIFRSVASGYDVQLLGGVTSKASTAALNKLAFGVNMLGACLHLGLSPIHTCCD